MREVRSEQPSMTVAYCGLCDWRRRTSEGVSRHDLNLAMIDHYVETGHTPIETAESELEVPSRDARPTA